MWKSVVGLVLVLHLFSPGQVMQASASIQAIATNPATHRVKSGTLKMSAVSVSSGLQTGTALSLTSRQSYFYVKNFGTLELSSFRLSQTRNATIRYCGVQGFQTSPVSYRTCFDGTSAQSLGSNNNISKIDLAVTLAPGESHQFSADTNSNNSNPITIRVTPANR